MESRVLFVCTGNFYRSRFAEAVFNYHAAERRLGWKAFSRGLAIHWAEGYLSPFTIQALEERQIDLHYTGPARRQLSEHDLQDAALVIALDRQEHYPMMLEQFPGWADKIRYWDVADVQFREPEDALPVIEEQVMKLLDRLDDEQPSRH